MADGHGRRRLLCAHRSGRHGNEPAVLAGQQQRRPQRCINNCTASGASWTERTGGWTGDTQSFILPYDIFNGGSAAGNDCGRPARLPAAAIWSPAPTGSGRRSPAPAPTATWYVNNPANLTKQTLGNRSFINQLKYSPKTSTTVIVGTNDGNVQIGRQPRHRLEPSTWVNVTGGNAVLPNRPILDVALDPTTTTAPIGYAAVGGFNANTPSTPGHVFQVVCTANCASFTWTDKTGNLPDIPVDSIIANPNFPQQVFAGTDWGLYFTDDITAANPTWSRFENGLPHSMIWDMQIDRGSTTLSVWTRGRGAYVWPLPGNRGDTESDTYHNTGHYSDTYTYSDYRTDTDTNSISRDNTVTNSDSYSHHCTHGNTLPDTERNRDANSLARTSREPLHSPPCSDR